MTEIFADDDDGRVSRSDVPDAAVEVKDGWLSYGRSKKTRLHVLQNLNMSVPRGSIYGLLGPSGCGKTTLLRCIVGRLRLDKGRLLLFGGRPGDGTVAIPGRDVGYMPQELALFLELTISETLRYFSRLHGMSKQQRIERVEFLLNFLNLPKEKKLIKNLSGGQQRRVSFAAALLHQPPLLILDEPTVGVDPILRLSIWNHLVEMSNSSEVTIIITTHYIEEARQANVVALMRFGHLLAEAPPQHLLDKYRVDNLEKVFLKLCQSEDPKMESGNVSQQGKSNTITSASHSNDTTVLVTTDVSYKDNPSTFRRRLKECCRIPSCGKINALVIKNLTKLSRMPSFLLFQFLVPSIQIILFCLAIGGNPQHLPVNIYSIDSGQAGAWYLGNLSTDIIIQEKVSSYGEGITNVLETKCWAIMSIGKNFSEYLPLRLSMPSPEVINGSSILIRMDMTNQQIAYTLQREFMRAFEAFGRSWLSSIGMDPDTVASPVVFGEPIYGNKDPTFTEFMAPGTIIVITFFMAVGLTSLAFVIERKEGLLDRSYAAGVNTVEVMISHLITQIGVMVVQVTLMLTFLIVVFRLPSEGNLLWVVLLTLLQGFGGMCYGLFISTICNEENSAITLSLGTFYPNLLLSGIVWPLEAMPKPMEYISRLLPMTYAVEALRCVLGRGQGIQDRGVWIGYVATIIWILVFLLSSAFIMKIKRA